MLYKLTASSDAEYWPYQSFFLLTSDLMLLLPGPHEERGVHLVTSRVDKSKETVEFRLILL